jgi:DNA-directed RNA polymerase subunit beta
MRSPIHYENLPHLLECQKSQFRAFIDHGLQEVYEHEFPLWQLMGKDHDGINLGFPIINLHVRPRKYLLRRLGIDDKGHFRYSYGAELYLPFLLTKHNTTWSAQNFISIGQIPLLTDHGFFDFHGNRRVLLPQLVRSAGNYVKLQIRSKNRRIYSSSFYSDMGCWLTIFNSMDGSYFIRLNKYTPMALDSFLSALRPPSQLRYMASNIINDDSIKRVNLDKQNSTITSKKRVIEKFSSFLVKKRQKKVGWMYTEYYVLDYQVFRNKTKGNGKTHIKKSIFEPLILDDLSYAAKYHIYDHRAKRYIFIDPSFPQYFVIDFFVDLIKLQLTSSGNEDFEDHVKSTRNFNLLLSHADYKTYSIEKLSQNLKLLLGMNIANKNLLYRLIRFQLHIGNSTNAFEKITLDPSCSEWSRIHDLIYCYFSHISARLLKQYLDEWSVLLNTIKFWHTFLFHPSFYDLSFHGRTQMNQKYGRQRGVQALVFQPQDAFFGSLQLFLLQVGRTKIDNMDHLENQSIRSVYYQFKEVLSQAFTTFIQSPMTLVHDRAYKLGLPFGWDIIVPFKLQIKKHRCYAWEKRKEPALYIENDVVTESFKTLFSNDPLAQLLDETNSLGQLTQTRKLSRLGIQGLSRNAGVEARNINPSHFTRLCPIETPEGKNVGLVNTVPNGGHIDERGYICGIFHTNKVRCAFLFNGSVSLESAASCLHQGNDSTSYINRSPWGTQTIPTQNISIATSLIPFLEHNDANRSLMGSNMQRQSLLVMHPAKPFVGTGLEKGVPMANALQCIESGKLILITDTLLIIHGKRLQFYSLKKAMKYKPNLRWKTSLFAGEWILRGTLLADESGLGELTVGQNLIVGYIAWNGFNFEDAIVLNDSVLKHQQFTSLAVQEVIIKSNTEFFFRVRPSDETDIRGFIKVGTEVQPGTILATQISLDRTPMLSPAEKLFSYIVSSIPLPILEHIRFVWSGEYGKVSKVTFIPEVRILDPEEPTIIHDPVLLLNGFDNLEIDPQKYHWLKKHCTIGSLLIKILVKRNLKLGDKLAGRHGNKGIISLLMPENKMPYLQNGQNLHILLNPLGVPSRMNVGQIFECLLGLISYFERKQVKLMGFDERFGVEASRNFLLSRLYNTNQLFFELNTPGKVFIFDGQTHRPFLQPITIGIAYILKLMHQVDEKIHARSTGPYNQLTEQPLRGKTSLGGQRVGEMEVWAFKGYGTSYLLQELLGTKSDSLFARNSLYSSFVNQHDIEDFPEIERPECLIVFLHQLRSMYLSLEYYWY